jgi:hypothetical protein
MTHDGYVSTTSSSAVGLHIYLHLPNIVICIQELVQGFASETVMLLYIQCTYIFNIMSVALLDTLHSGSGGPCLP